MERRYIQKEDIYEREIYEEEIYSEKRYITERKYIYNWKHKQGETKNDKLIILMKIIWKDL